MNLRLSCTATDQTGNAGGQNCWINQVFWTGALRGTCVLLIIWMPIEKMIIKKLIVKYGLDGGL